MLLDDSDRRRIEAQLCHDLGAGDLIRLTGGFRKLRHGLEGRGKRGGFRVIHFPDVKCGHVYMILAYRKDQKDTLTNREKGEIRKPAAALKSEDC